MNSNLLTFVADPNHAILLLLCGILFLYAEFNKPGTVVLGCLGALFVMYALYGLDHVPIRPSAVVLLAMSLGLLALGLRSPFRNLPAIAATPCLIIGIWKLVIAPPVHPVVAIVCGAIFSTVTTWLLRIALLARRNKSLVGPLTMIDKLAIVHTELSPSGQVEVRGELWHATLAGGDFLPRGSSVVVREVHGLELTVVPAPSRPPRVQH